MEGKTQRSFGTGSILAAWQKPSLLSLQAELSEVSGQKPPRIGGTWLTCQGLAYVGETALWPHTSGRTCALSHPQGDMRFGTLWLQFIMYKLKLSTGNKAVNRSVAGAVGSGLAAWNADYVVLLVPHTEKRKKVPENYPRWRQLDLNSFQHRLRFFYPMKARWTSPCEEQGNPSTRV